MERQQLSGERQAEEEDVELELFEAVKGVALENESLKAMECWLWNRSMVVGVMYDMDVYAIVYANLIMV